jgi:hypothetical protein
MFNSSLITILRNFGCVAVASFLCALALRVEENCEMNLRVIGCEVRELTEVFFFFCAAGDRL